MRDLFEMFALVCGKNVDYGVTNVAILCDQIEHWLIVALFWIQYWIYPVPYARF